MVVGLVGLSLALIAPVTLAADVPASADCPALAHCLAVVIKGVAGVDTCVAGRGTCETPVSWEAVAVGATLADAGSLTVTFRNCSGGGATSWDAIPGAGAVVASCSQTIHHPAGTCLRDVENEATATLAWGAQSASLTARDTVMPCAL
jgi:hypothetical protein